MRVRKRRLLLGVMLPFAVMTYGVGTILRLVSRRALNSRTSSRFAERQEQLDLTEKARWAKRKILEGLHPDDHVRYLLDRGRCAACAERPRVCAAHATQRTWIGSSCKDSRALLSWLLR
jgi:hypothetical protein